MQCPTCPTLLIELKVGGLELDECPRCLGMWFDPGELQRLMGEALQATRGMQQRYLPPTGDEKIPARSACPRCVSGRLVERDEAGHLLAGCARCGGAWVPGTLLSYILSVEDIPEDLEELESLAEAGGPIGERPDLLPTPPAGVPAVRLEPPPAQVASEASARPAEPPSPPAVRESPARPSTAPLPPPAPHAGFARRAAQPKAPTGACPACRSRFFEAVSHEGQGFHRCTKCEGLFFSRGGLPQFLSGRPGGWSAPESLVSPEPEGKPPCAVCAAPMNPMRWGDRPVRVWACEGCWSTFASAEGVRRFVWPERYLEESAQSAPALALWRAFDTFTDWLTRPRTTDAWRARFGRRW